MQLSGRHLVPEPARHLRQHPARAPATRALIDHQGQQARLRQLVHLPSSTSILNCASSDSTIPLRLSSKRQIISAM